MQTVILCGGKGTRLKNLLNNLPKPMALISEKPFLSYIIELLKLNDTSKILLLTGYMSEIIENYISSNDFGIEISFKKEGTPLGTGGALLNAWNMLEDEFILINGDTYFDINYNKFFNFVRNNNVHACISLRFVNDVSRYGSVRFNDEHRILEFIEKGKQSRAMNGDHINGGIYYFKKHILNNIYSEWDKKSALSMETKIFPQLAAEKLLYGCPIDGRFIDIGIPEDYVLAQREVPEWLNETLSKLTVGGI